MKFDYFVVYENNFHIIFSHFALFSKGHGEMPKKTVIEGVLHPYPKVNSVK